MGRFDLNLNDLIEGQVIKKSTLTGVYGQLNASLDDGIGPENIREEGLDRRSFENMEGSHFQFGQTCELRNEAIIVARAPIEGSSIGPNGFSYGPIDGLTSVHDDYPRVDFSWDPEVDTYAVVRCSFFVSQQRNDGRHTPTVSAHLGNDAWDFGLRVSPKWGSHATSGSLKPKAPGGSGGVFPYQRVCLNPAFSWVDKVFTSGAAEEGGPARYKFDRISSMRQSVCMFAVFGVGGASSAYNESIYELNEATTVKTELVYRTRFGNYSYDVATEPGSEGSATGTQTNHVKIDGLHMNVTKYRR